MEHIIQYDWSFSHRETSFVNEGDIDNCVIEKILRNKFTDPTVSSDEEESEAKKPKINWEEVFSKKQFGNFNDKRIYVPGIKRVAPFPKLSSLTVQQHYQCLKVLCAENPDILATEFIGRPTKNDHNVFQQVQELYLQEQIEYKEWAKKQWISIDCLKSLRPKPCLEMVYDAEHKIQVHAIQAFPKSFKMAAQIPLESNNAKCHMVLTKNIINVDIEQLPEIQVPNMTTKKVIVASETSIPEPCIKHPCRFVLPADESLMTILPLPEVHRELAQFASDNEVSCIISEEALRCIIEQSSQWELTLSVCDVVQEDGETMNVIVISNEFSIEKHPAQTRTYRAYTHLLYSALIPPSERKKLYTLQQGKPKEQTQQKTIIVPQNIELHDSSDEEDENQLFIDTGLMTGDEESKLSAPNLNKSDSHLDTQKNPTNNENNDVTDNQTSKSANDSGESIFDECQIGIYSCSCEDTIFENPPPRSYKKWKVTKNENKESYNLIIHCPHKTRLESNEVILEPIIEYQLALGGSQQRSDKLTSLATSLLLRDNARLINVRIDASTGEVVTVENKSLEEFQLTYDVDLTQTANYLYTVINQLQGLLPGKYLLHHDSSLGSNAFLYAVESTGSKDTLTIPSLETPRGERDEIGYITAPLLSNTLLPYHKFRKILPCAFTPFQTQVARPPKRPITRQKTPPQACLWPKKKKKKGPKK